MNHSFLPFLLPALRPQRLCALCCILCLATPAISQQTSCCEPIKRQGQTAFDQKNYDKAIEIWSQGKKCPDAAKCPELDGLIKKAQTEEQNRKAGQARQRQAEQPAPPRPDMVIIRGGTFTMGCTSEQRDCRDAEKPAHEVTVSDFYLGRYAVTVREFKAFVDATGYKTDAEKEGWSWVWTGSWEKKEGLNWKHDANGNIRPASEMNHPVLYVSWYDAVAYCNWLSEQQGLRKVYTIRGREVVADWSANGYRLPTEAEWEYAARGGGKSVLFGNGKNVADPSEINFDGSARWKKAYSVAGVYREKTVPVGSLNSPNGLGLHDMSGNVYEWCWDWKADYSSSSKTNPRGPERGSDRVGRGGSWFSTPRLCRVAYRNYNAPTGRYFNVGFRLARSS